MNVKDATVLLGKCAAFDNRKPTQATVLAWSEALDDMPVQDALNFVTQHYAASRDWIMPSDLNREWHQLRRLRQDAVPQAQRPQPPQDLDGPTYLVWRRAVSRAISHGQPAEQVTAAAYEAIGRTPEIEAPTSKHEINIERVGRSL